VHGERLRPGLEVRAASLVVIRQFLFPGFLFIKPTPAGSFEVLPQTFWWHVHRTAFLFDWLEAGGFPATAAISVP
jgi:hypothetical protein